MLLAAALITAVLAQNPPAPAVTTGAADGITTSAAMVHGTVNPHGAATTFHVEYGTTSGYGLKSAEQSAGAGTDAVNVSAALSRLTADTTYHYTVVATNAAGATHGADRTLHTAIVPRAPVASTRPATGIAPLGATLVGSVTPRGLDTSVHFIYGPTTAYGATTADVPVGAGASPVSVRTAISGLQPHTQYHFRAVATNASGTARGGDRAFTTGRAPTGVTITPAITRVVWGSSLQVTGAVTGIGSVPVALERQAFPFGAGYETVASTTAAVNGGFSFVVPPLYVASRLRAVTRTEIVAASPPRLISVAAKVGVKTRRAGRRHVRLSGAIWPAVPNGRLSLQLRSRSGRWSAIRHAQPRPLSGGRSQYRFTVTRARRALAYRVVVVANDGGAHVPGASRTVRVARRR